MYDELNQFARNDVWILVPKTNEMNVIGTKWVFKINYASKVLLLEMRLG